MLISGTHYWIIYWFGLPLQAHTLFRYVLYTCIDHIWYCFLFHVLVHVLYMYMFFTYTAHVLQVLTLLIMKPLNYFGRFYETLTKNKNKTCSNLWLCVVTPHSSGFLSSTHLSLFFWLMSLIIYHQQLALACMHLLKLPMFNSKVILREKLLYAISSGAGFELS